MWSAGGKRNPLAFGQVVPFPSRTTIYARGISGAVVARARTFRPVMAKTFPAQSRNQTPQHVHPLRVPTGDSP